MNQFKPETVIRFELLRKSVMPVEIYNIVGQKVVMLVQESYESGAYDVNWDGWIITAKHDRSVFTPTSCALGKPPSPAR